MDVPVELSRILITELGDQQVIFLKEKDGDRSFPILIGIAEALAIDRRLKGQTTPRPLTHELLGNVIHEMGGQIEKVVVSDIRDQTFIATLHLRQNGRLLEIDSRPSDAIALGVGFETPLFVSERVFQSVLSEPATAEERLELLRRRKDMLDQRIEELESHLANEEILEELTPRQLKEMRRQLKDCRVEYEAIEQVLRKHG
jgi:hypothetical protein